MDTIKKIEQYIERSNVPENLSREYDMRWSEYMVLADVEQRSDAVILAFNYGRAKGYRAAKVEARRRREAAAQ